MFAAEAVVEFGDLMILGMAFPNIAGILLLTGRVKADLDDYMRRLAAGEFPKQR
ncbi:MAG: alanine:cation symporter family protein [Myxococcota bacterium]|nr:alanine:cation symporter family protein [Myxococcota bacterium]